MRPSYPAPNRAWKLLVAAFTAATITGCSALKVYPVKGKVVLKGGMPVTTGGRIEFQSMANPQVKATGWIDLRDGSFSLTTYNDGKPIEGAVEGPHRVVVEMRNPVVVFTLTDVYTVGRQENEFTIEVPKPRR